MKSGKTDQSKSRSPFSASKKHLSVQMMRVRATEKQGLQEMFKFCL